MYVTLVPAYGRDYKSAKAVKEDWNANKDFIISNLFHPSDGKPMNREQAQPGEKYMIRYDGQRKQVSVK